MVKIYIDPGHGGQDSGAVGNGLQEKTIALHIGTRIKDILLAEYDNIFILMSRTGDSYPSLSERTNQANAWGADFYLSIHINAGGGSGYEDYIYPGSGAPTSTYQSNIHSEIMKLVDWPDRGKKTANFHVLRETRMPALLTENGFIDNLSDAAKLKSASVIESLARGHVNGIVKSFNLPKKPKAVYHTVISGDTVYSLGQTYGSSIQQIKNWNNLDNKYTIYAGQSLRVK
ncbi:N-acetylmuramoyl-L-alanine amidase [Bacillus infantis]|uniref:N-acetylmuramoyl-L-alanine amidase family protein n=1 Tax=Bacillus infantis TaxID=324767 RepID=UPI000B9A77AE|nr:N-acetylmuramoyl-L-alanine amidase [Bacillus infantis]MCP1161279.1 N-acetylmuramoyl-L-alanine amidase [Bacillus infantis]OXT15235.1 N-acetylmuramoyl-L-alanine amidase [Bacillus sp. OG2]